MQEEIRELTQEEIAEVAGGLTPSKGGGGLLCLLDRIEDRIECFIKSLFRSGSTVESDIRLKHDVTELGRLPNGLGFYRFSYNGSDEAYVGVMAQEVQSVVPSAVVRGSDGYLRVRYERLGLKFQTWDEWVASGQKIPGALKAH
jgi:hypothetical protein